MNGAAAVAQQLRDITRETEELSAETESYIAPQAKKDFEREVNTLKEVLTREGQKSHQPRQAPASSPETPPQLTNPVEQLTRLGTHYGGGQVSRLRPRWRQLPIG